MAFVGRIGAVLGVGIVAVLAAGCAGDLEGLRDADGNEWTPGQFTYGQLVRTSQTRQYGDHLLETDEDGLATMAPDQIHTSFSVVPQLKVETVSKAHMGDLDFVAKALFKKRGDFIVTIEVPNGPVLASVSLADQELLTAAQLKNRDARHATFQSLGIEVPGSLAGPGTRFPAALFACLDTNRNGECADEVVDSLEDVEFDRTPNVIYFAGLEGLVVGEGEERTLTFDRVGLDALGSPEWIMGEVLKNLPSADEGVPLSMTLAVEGRGGEVPKLNETGTEITPIELGTIQEEERLIALRKAQQAKKKKRQKRTNGCFVRGTRILLGNGQTLAVEEIYAGSMVANAAGVTGEVLKAVAGPERLPVIELTTAAGQTVRVTQTHPMLTPAGLRMARDLGVGDELVAADRSEVTISAVRRLPYGDLVFNFVLPGTEEADHLVNAEGLITGDLFLQQRLSASE